MKKTKTIELAAWENLGRKYSQLLTPIVPDEHDSETYGLLIAKHLKNKKNAKIMIMGSTPPLRRVLYTYEALYNAEVFCVDINQTMYKAMTAFLSVTRNAKEKILLRNWLTTQFSDRYFDLVVGDEVICQINQEQHDNLFREINRILKKEGVWIIRHNLALAINKKDTPLNVVLDIAKKIKSGEYSFQLAASIAVMRLFYYSGANNIQNSFANHLELIKKEFQRELKTSPDRKIFEELMYIIEDNFVSLTGDTAWYILNEKQSENELKKIFTIKDKIYSSDHAFVKNVPIYVLENKI